MQPERELTLSLALKIVLVPMTLCLIFDLIAGIFLGANFEKLMLEYPIILIVIPGLMGLRGNVFGSLGSRISTSLYLGSSLPSIRDKYISKNVFFSIWAATIPAIILLFVGGIKFFNLNLFLTATEIVIDSSILISAILGFLTALIVTQSFRRGFDPDSFIGPAVTTFADLVSIPSIILFIFLFENIKNFWIISLLLLAFLMIAIYISIRGEYERKAYKETLIIISLLALVQSMTGNILQEFSGIIYKAVLLSFAYPAIIGSIGNYGSIVVARTSTKLHLGEVEHFKKGFTDAIYIFPTTLVVALIIYLISLVSSAHFTGFIPPLWLTFVYFLTAYLSLAILILIFSTAISIWLYKKGVDPDNAGIPLITTIADIFGTVVVVFLAYVMV